MYGHASEPSLVYAYGAKAPRTNADAVRDQMYAARRYRNDLVALERERRDQVNEIIRTYAPRLIELDELIEQLDAEITEARSAIRRSNAAARSKDPSSEQVRSITEMRAEIRALRAEHKDLRKATYARDDVRAALTEVEAATRDRAKALRAAVPVHWGTYLVVEAGLRGINSGPPPRFVGRDWPGTLAVQIQGGCTWADLLQGVGAARVEQLPLPARATPGGRRSKRLWHILHFRIGSTGPRNRTPIMAEVPFSLHRPVPADARVKWIHLSRRLRGTNEEWRVAFVLSRAAWPRADTVTAAGTAAANLGFRRLADGSVRVAYVVGSDGHREELVLPARDLTRWSHADSLQSIRDREFDLARAALVHWLATAENVPEWMCEATSNAAQWRSEARLASVVHRWKGERFDGDAEMFERMEAWRKQDEHLYDWRSHEQVKAVRWRDDLYRRFAARLRWRYETVLLDDTDWAKLRQRPEAEADTEVVNVRAIASIASPGRLREIIMHGHPGARREPATDLTRTCHYCGVVDPSLDVLPLTVHCTACGSDADQDLRAAANLLARASGTVANA